MLLFELYTKTMYLILTCTTYFLNPRINPQLYIQTPSSSYSVDISLFFWTTFMRPCEVVAVPEVLLSGNHRQVKGEERCCGIRRISSLLYRPLSPLVPSIPFSPLTFVSNSPSLHSLPLLPPVLPSILLIHLFSLPLFCLPFHYHSQDYIILPLLFFFSFMPPFVIRGV